MGRQKWPMPRQIRIVMAGGICHVMARGDRQEPIFYGDEDRWLLLRTFGEACARCGWRVQAWVLMNNH
jgi:putative transposase